MPVGQRYWTLVGGDVIQEVSSSISAVVVGLGLTVVQLHLLRRQLKDGQEASRAAALRAVNGMDAKLQYLIEAPELRGHRSLNWNWIQRHRIFPAHLF